MVVVFVVGVVEVVVGVVLSSCVWLSLSFEVVDVDVVVASVLAGVIGSVVEWWSAVVVGALSVVVVWGGVVVIEVVGGVEVVVVVVSVVVGLPAQYPTFSSGLAGGLGGGT